MVQCLIFNPSAEAALGETCVSNIRVGFTPQETICMEKAMRIESGKNRRKANPILLFLDEISLLYTKAIYFDSFET